MKVIIAGSRDITNYDVVRACIEDAINRTGWHVDTVLSGCARGVDRLGERWAELHGIPVERFPADWARYGRRAGYLRNEEMAKVADALIAIWDGVSPGTKHMIRLAFRQNLKFAIYTLARGYPQLLMLKR